MRIEFDPAMDLVYLIVDDVTIDMMTSAEYEQEFGFPAWSAMIRTKLKR
jgi:hypothetical protein